MSDLASSTNLRAFTGPQEFAVGDFKLRKFSAGSMALCRQIGVTMIDGLTSGLDKNEIQKQLVAFLWVHTWPLQEVLQACEKPLEQLNREHLVPFSFEVSIPTLTKLADFIEAQLAGIDSAVVDIKEKPPIPGANPPEEPPNS